MSPRHESKIARTNGAKAPEGLEKSPRSELRHGLTAKTLALSNESQTKGDRFFEAFVQKFAPRGAVELELVTEMVAASG